MAGRNVYRLPGMEKRCDSFESFDEDPYEATQTDGGYENVEMGQLRSSAAPQSTNLGTAGAKPPENLKRDPSNSVDVKKIAIITIILIISLGLGVSALVLVLKKSSEAEKDFADSQKKFHLIAQQSNLVKSTLANLSQAQNTLVRELGTELAENSAKQRHLTDMALADLSLTQDTRLKVSQKKSEKEIASLKRSIEWQKDTSAELRRELAVKSAEWTSTNNGLKTDLSSVHRQFSTYSTSIAILQSQMKNLMTLLPKVRLVGGSSGYGLIKILYQGVWGTICDDGWGTNDALVICRMLGYTRVIHSNRGAAYGQGTGKIWLDNVQCTGSETNIAFCPHEGWGVLRSCSHREDVSVYCT